MWKTNKRNNILFRVLRFRYLFILNGVIILLFAFVLGREFVRDSEIQKDIVALQDQADEIETRNLEIVELGGLLQTESFIEREARLKLGLKKPGEQVVVVEHDDNSEEIQGNADGVTSPLVTLVDSSKNPENYSNPAKWRFYFFERDQYAKLVVYGKVK